MLVYGKYITCHGLGTLREGSETPTLLVGQSGMGWDILWVRCRHRSKDCSKAHHLPSRAYTIWVGRVIPKNNLHHDHVCTDEFTQHVLVHGLAHLHNCYS